MVSGPGSGFCVSKAREGVLMHRRKCPVPHAKALAKPIALLTLAVAAAGFPLAADAQVLDRWKHPPARSGAQLFGAAARTTGLRPQATPAIEPRRGDARAKRRPRVRTRAPQ